MVFLSSFCTCPSTQVDIHAISIPHSADKLFSLLPPPSLPDIPDLLLPDEDHRNFSFNNLLLKVLLQRSVLPYSFMTTPSEIRLCGSDLQSIETYELEHQITRYPPSSQGRHSEPACCEKKKSIPLPKSARGLIDQTTRAT